MNVRWSGRFAGLCIALFSLVSCAGLAHAQADDTAQRPADLLVFGGYGYTVPDYGHGHNSGFTVGADYDRSFGWAFIPGLELRANLNSSSYTTEHSYLLGPRLHINLAHRFHPYAYFLAGAGTITYPEYDTTIHDGGFVLSYGAGVDTDITHNVMLRVDYQSESWNMGLNAFTKPQGGDFTIAPSTITVGVTYRIPFKRWLDSSHNHNR